MTMSLSNVNTGDLLIGAGAIMCEANGFDPAKEHHLRDQMVELITLTESIYACGVAASVYGKADPYSHTFMPDPVFSNIGKLLLATKIYDMHRIAHYGMSVVINLVGLINMNLIVWYAMDSEWWFDCHTTRAR